MLRKNLGKNLNKKLSDKEIIKKEIIRMSNKYNLKSISFSPKKKKKIYYYISKMNKNLEKNYNSSNKNFSNFLIESLIKKKQSHFYAKLRDEEIYNENKEYLIQIYNKKESKKKIKNYTIYYKNYSEYFCRPIISDFSCNKIMNKHMELKAEIFYEENYAKKPKKSKIEGKGNKDYNIFNKDIVKEIEDEKHSKRKKLFCGFNQSLNKSSSIDNISNIYPYPIKLIKLKENNTSTSNSLNSLLYMLTKTYKKEKEKENRTSLHSLNKNSPIKNNININNPLYSKLKHQILSNNLSPSIIYKKNIFKRKFDYPLSYNENQKLKKTSSKIRNLYSNRKLSFYKSNNNNTTQNLIKYIRKSDKYIRNNPSHLRVNLKSPMNLYLAQSKLIRSTSNVNKYSVRISKNSNFNSSRNSNIISNNSRYKKISRKSSSDDNIVINSNNVRNYKKNYSNLSLNPSLNKISFEFFSNKHNSMKFGKLVFPNKNF